MKQKEIIERFSFSVFAIYYFVAILFTISGLFSLGFFIFLLGVLSGFAFGDWG